MYFAFIIQLKYIKLYHWLLMFNNWNRFNIIKLSKKDKCSRHPGRLRFSWNKTNNWFCILRFNFYYNENDQYSWLIYVLCLATLNNDKGLSIALSIGENILYLVISHIMKFIHGRDHIASSQCNNAFLDKGHLIRQTRIHTGEKPYQCSLCNKTFLNKFLIDHMMINSGVKP